MPFGFPLQFGYAALALLVAGESAGIPIPGETALVLASVMAAKGHLSFPLVVVTAALAAIVGDNCGYLLGRLGGYRLLAGGGPFRAQRTRLLARGDAFFTRHGAAAVLVGRWTPVLRVTAAVLAGTHHMKWRRFLLWNSLGGAGWAMTIGGAAYWLGGKVPGAFLGIGIATSLIWVAGLGARAAYSRLRERSHPGAHLLHQSRAAHPEHVAPGFGSVAVWRVAAWVAGVAVLAVVGSVLLEIPDF